MGRWSNAVKTREAMERSARLGALPPTPGQAERTHPPPARADVVGLEPRARLSAAGAQVVRAGVARAPRAGGGGVTTQDPQAKARLPATRAGGYRAHGAVGVRARLSAPQERGGAPGRKGAHHRGAQPRPPRPHRRDLPRERRARRLARPPRLEPRGRRRGRRRHRQVHPRQDRRPQRRRPVPRSGRRRRAAPQPRHPRHPRIRALALPRRRAPPRVRGRPGRHRRDLRHRRDGQLRRNPRARASPASPR